MKLKITQHFTSKAGDTFKSSVAQEDTPAKAFLELDRACRRAYEAISLGQTVKETITIEVEL